MKSLICYLSPKLKEHIRDKKFFFSFDDNIENKNPIPLDVNKFFIIHARTTKFILSRYELPKVMYKEVKQWK